MKGSLLKGSLLGWHVTGHGHVYSRSGGFLARCGGPAICSECARDLAQKQAVERCERKDDDRLKVARPQ